jgi:hypothetical protein
MPDWRQFVRERLAQLQAETQEREEVIEELASHLEDTSDQLRNNGASPEQAMRGAISQVESWKKLQEEIQIARSREDIVNARTSRLWIPGIVTLGLSVLTLVGFALLRLNPGPFGSRSHQDIWWSHLQHGQIAKLAVINEYTVWLMALPFIGALGAYLSTRAGGGLAEVVTSGAFPALAWLVIVGIVLSFAATLGQSLDMNALVDPLGVLTLMVLVPAACLLLGVAVYRAAARARIKSVA